MQDGISNCVQRAAVVAGATGLVGREVVRRLLAAERYGRVVALARRPIAVPDAIFVVATADFQRLDQVLAPATSGVADIVTAPLRRLIPAKLRPISAADVAQAMIDAALAACPPGVVESAQMQGAAKRAA